MTKKVVLVASAAPLFVVPTMVVAVMAIDASQRLPAMEVHRKMVMDQFIELKPSTFVGDGELEMVEQWLKDMEWIFYFMNCIEEEKVRIAEFQLQGNAEM